MLNQEHTFLIPYFNSRKRYVRRTKSVAEYNMVNWLRKTMRCFVYETHKFYPNIECEYYFSIPNNSFKICKFFIVEIKMSIWTNIATQEIQALFLSWYLNGIYVTVIQTFFSCDFNNSSAFCMTNSGMVAFHQYITMAKPMIFQVTWEFSQVKNRKYQNTDIKPYILELKSESRS